jgi:Ca2+-binding EF-hand superfamily protein
MKMIQCFSSVILSAATFAMLTPAAAQQQAQIEAKFKEADKNGDGKLTLGEAKAGMPRVASNFDMIDKDKKGYVTLEDIKAAMSSRGQ